MSRTDALVYRLKTQACLADKYGKKGDEKIYRDAIEAIERYEDALRIIVGDLQPIDNLMSNVDIARAALD